MPNCNQHTLLTRRCAILITYHKIGTKLSSARSFLHVHWYTSLGEVYSGRCEGRELDAVWVKRPSIALVSEYHVLDTDVA